MMERSIIASVSPDGNLQFDIMNAERLDDATMLECLQALEKVAVRLWPELHSPKPLVVGSFE